MGCLPPLRDEGPEPVEEVAKTVEDQAQIDEDGDGVIDGVVDVGKEAFGRGVQPGRVVGVTLVTLFHVERGWLVAFSLEAIGDLLASESLADAIATGVVLH